MFNVHAHADADADAHAQHSTHIHQQWLHVCAAEEKKSKL